MSKYVAIFLLLFIPYFFSETHGKETDIKSKLKLIPNEDRQCIEDLFKELIFSKQFGYVIFGYKPMVWDSIDTNILSINPLYSKNITYNRIWSNYKIWQKHQNNFPMENYFFGVVNNLNDPSSRTIVFINRSVCSQTIYKHIEIFKKIFGDSVNAESILQKLETHENILQEAMKNSHLGLGILLGFGKRNSLAFQKRHEISEQYSPPFDLDILEKIHQASLTLTNSSKTEEILSLINLPYYSEDKNHPENIQIKEKYRKARQTIGEICVQDNFLEILLEKLTEKTNKGIKMKAM